MILELDEFVNLTMLQTTALFVKFKEEDNLNKQSMELIKNINELNQFKTTLDNVMTFVDGQSTSKSKVSSIFG